MKHVVLIGGTGVFGRRLARHLAPMAGIQLTVTSRSAKKAKELAATLRGEHAGADIKGMALDTGDAFEHAMASLAPWAVIDCSGPFQGAGYDTARQVLGLGCHMIDLADARDYLLGYGEALDDLAKSKGVCGFAGASSTPALSSAVVAELVAGWQSIESLEIAITPGGKSQVGRSVIKAILTYAGKPIPAWEGGELAETIGWSNGRSLDIPGLGNRRVATAETADAQILGPLYQVAGSIRFAAGLESRLEQYGLENLSTLVRRKLFPDPQFLVPLLVRARSLTQWMTGDTGGMIVLTTGRDGDGQPVRKRWSLLAKDDHGPCVPVLAAAAVVRALLKDDFSPGASPGASVVSGQLPLAAIEAEMQYYSIETRIDDLAL